MSKFSKQYISACCPHLASSEVACVYDEIHTTFKSLDLVHAEDVRTIARQLFPDVQEKPFNPVADNANVYDLSLGSMQMFNIQDLSFTRNKNRKHPPIFSVNEVTIWRWVKQGIFPEPVKIGGKRFWRAKDIAELIKEKKLPARLTDYESSPVIAPKDMEKLNQFRITEAISSLEAAQQWLSKVRSPSDTVGMAIRDIGMIADRLQGVKQ